MDFFGSKKEVFVEKIKQVQKSFVLKFRNFDSEKDIKIFIGKEIYVNSEDVITPPENYFFIHDLIGSKVIHNDLELGIIEDVLSVPANDIYVIKSKEGKEILIPAVLKFIESFDPNKKILKLKPGDKFYEFDDED